MPVVFKWDQFLSPHTIIWQCLATFLVVPAEGCCWLLALVGRGLRCCYPPYRAQDSPSTTKIYLSQNVNGAEKP